MRNAAQRPSIDAEGLLREYAMTGNTAIRDRVVEAHLYIALDRRPSLFRPRRGL